jgi:hypothetical protein
VVHRLVDQTISRQTSEVRLDLAGAKIVSHTTTNIRPDQGHIHLLVDGKLVAMNYGLDERLPNLTSCKGPRCLIHTGVPGLHAHPGWFRGWR